MPMARESQIKKPRMIFLDLMNTIMFNHDRFGPQENYPAVYHALGGSNLADEELHLIIGRAVERIEIDYSEPERYENFPHARYYLRAEAARLGKNLSQTDRLALNLTFAFQECGWIDAIHARAIEKLAREYPLAIISNLWGVPYFCNRVLRISRLHRCFLGAYYSSELGMQKPARSIFQYVAAKHALLPEHCLMIGDNLEADIHAAREAGMQALWISYGRESDVPQALDFPDAVELLVSHT
ncbi:MAG: hypothetical protein CMN76_03140 [Spirochaetaceae bacterium]|nr:hypothetical protein [Spirochaetaceae bacterium]